jgi:hypothetical protein
LKDGHVDGGDYDFLLGKSLLMLFMLETNLLLLLLLLVFQLIKNNLLFILFFVVMLNLDVIDNVFSHEIPIVVVPMSKDSLEKIYDV